MEWAISKYINASIMRVINYCVLFVSVFGTGSQTVESMILSIPRWKLSNGLGVLMLLVLISILTGIFIASERVSGIDFFEWKKRERRKKEGIIQMFTIFGSMFTLGFFILLISTVFGTDINGWVIAINAIGIAFMLANAIYPDYFFCFAFDDMLLIGNVEDPPDGYEE